MKTEYNTKQKQIVIDFLSKNSNFQFSALDVAKGVKDKGIGTSTVYRQISNLCNDGIIRRFRGNNGKNTLYQFVGKDKHCNSHFHLKCTKCGGLTHLDCNSIMQLASHIEKEHGFNINIGETVIYGICTNCKG